MYSKPCFLCPTLLAFCHGCLKCVIALCIFKCLWRVMSIIWIGWHGTLLEKTHLWESRQLMKCCRPTETMDGSNSAWLGKPPVVAQPSITRHFLPLLILLSSPLSLCLFPCPLNYTFTQSLLPPFLSTLLLLCFFYFTLMFQFFFLCAFVTSQFFSNGLSFGMNESPQSKFSGCCTCEGAAEWGSTFTPHTL